MIVTMGILIFVHGGICIERNIDDPKVNEDQDEHQHQFHDPAGVILEPDHFFGDHRKWKEENDPQKEHLSDLDHCKKGGDPNGNRDDRHGCQTDQPFIGK